MTFAPVALFVYNRAWHTRRTIEALKACAEFARSPVFVFADGARSDSGRDAVAAARDVVREMLPDATVAEAPVNRGLAASIIAGVDLLTKQFGRAIVIEDDLLVHPEFLRFMNAALERYADAPRVMQVAGYIPEGAGGAGAALMPLTTSWGWATWDRAWVRFDASCSEAELRLRDPALSRRFDLDGAIDYSAMMAQQRAGKIDSWAVRWYWSVFRDDGLVVYPPRSLVRNIGFDGSGTHGSASVRRAALPSQDAKFDPLGPLEFPGDIAPDPVRFAALRDGLRRDFGGGTARRAARAMLRGMMRRFERA